MLAQVLVALLVRGNLFVPLSSALIINAGTPCVEPNIASQTVLPYDMSATFFCLKCAIIVVKLMRFDLRLGSGGVCSKSKGEWCFSSLAPAFRPPGRVSAIYLDNHAPFMKSLLGDQ
jgi:hypothetical protein